MTIAEKAKPRKKLGRITLFGFAAGIVLGCNPWNVNGLIGYGIMRSAFAITVTSFIRENLHSTIFRIEQELLALLTLAPCFFGLGVLAGFLHTCQYTRPSMSFPIGYCVAWIPQLLLSSRYFAHMGLQWYHMIPTGIYDLSYIPIFLLGSNATLGFRNFRQASLLRILLPYTLILVSLPFIAFLPFEATRSVCLLGVFSIAAWNSSPASPDSSNNPMDRSGGSAAS